MQQSKYKLLLPLAFAGVLILGMYLGIAFNAEIKRKLPAWANSGKLDQILRLIDKSYVDTLKITKLEDETIQDMLAKLDPHSSYIPATDLKAVNESLEGNFEGIGIEFYLLNDTIYVVSAISGGPSELLGIRSGDKIIKINNKTVAGKKIKNTNVTSLLRGPSGTKVNVSILRKGVTGLVDYTITRNKIPVNSVDVAYMAAPKIGYIKVSTFGATTYDEFYDAIVKLKNQGMTSMVLDLRGNPGGYLNTAIMMADEFLSNKKLIVYTQGKASPKKEEYATAAGNYEKGKLIVLIDEGSASASEIVAGAVQDWDRGIIVGRRSFGKGLVQEQTLFSDGSALRLTTARYYTPTGRCIQKPYGEGVEKYNEEMFNRYKHGELLSKDSIHQDASLKYKTPSGKIVYGGGGITPDVFVPIDTSNYTSYYGELISSGLLTDYCYNYVDQYKKSLVQYRNLDDFITKFHVDNELFRQFIEFAEQKGIKKDVNALNVSINALKIQLKALIARQLFKNEGYFRVMQDLDKTFLKSVELLQAG